MENINRKVKNRTIFLVMGLFIILGVGGVIALVGVPIIPGPFEIDPAIMQILSAHGVNSINIGEVTHNGNFHNFTLGFNNPEIQEGILSPRVLFYISTEQQDNNLHRNERVNMELKAIVSVLQNQIPTGDYSVAIQSQIIPVTIVPPIDPPNTPIE